MSAADSTQVADQPAMATAAAAPANLAILEFFFPGFGVISSGLQKYMGIDLNVYIPLVILVGCMTFAWQYLSEYVWGVIETYLMSSVEIRTDDEIYNMLMAWVAGQTFSKKSRRFIANTNLNSRAWYLWRWSDDDDEDDDNSDEQADGSISGQGKAKKALAYTPSFGNHNFWYKGRLLRFRRSQDRNQQGFLTSSEREEISIGCFGRNPAILKELLLEARAEYLKKDTKKTMIYRGGNRSGSTDPSWQRCMARTARPFSTVILNEKKKQEIIEDVREYLSPATRNWYSNRGIPWRRGYLLSGPPGTGKSSLSLALAGHFKMRIYIVSLSSPTANEESLMTLFSDLPQRCVVLLEDIDTAGLTHTREGGAKGAVVPAAAAAEAAAGAAMVPGQITAGEPAAPPNMRLSLSGLLNILDGVASQEGRVLIMTTNHIEKLDRALIRPGRVDMIVQFSLADREIISAIFRAIYAPLEGDDGLRKPISSVAGLSASESDKAAEEAAEEAAAKEARETAERIEALSEAFADKVPSHEFSPAEIQGFLLKHKRNAEAAIEGAEEWVEETRRQKKEKELRDAEEKRAAEEKKAEEEKKAAAEKTAPAEARSEAHSQASGDKTEKTEQARPKAEGEKNQRSTPTEGPAPNADATSKPSQQVLAGEGQEEKAKTAGSSRGGGEEGRALKSPASDSGYDTPGEA